MIRSFAGRETERFWRTGRSGRIPAELRARAQRKLSLLDAATDLKDLASPPGNRLEKLRGDREGQYSIRVSGRLRVCFRWEQGDAYEVEITDYH